AVSIFFFFFQAEDGIRDFHVTGVQTCALPISQIGRPCLLGYIGKCSAPCVGRVSAEEHRQIVEDFCEFLAGRTDQLVRRLEKKRSEERRVGKECRSRWAAYDEKQK